MRFLRFLIATILIGVPALAADSAAPAGLTMSDAIALALKNNVDVRVAAARTEAARGRAMREASDLLPQIVGTAQQTRTFRQNLAAVGFTAFPGAGFNPVIGPFNTFDARLHLTQSLLDIAAVNQFRSASAARRAAYSQQSLAREQVAAAAALSYVDVLRAQASITSAEAGSRLADTLLSQAEDQRRAGSAAGIDVARARTRAAEERLRVLQARADEHDALTRLKRVVGLPLGTTVQMTEPFQFEEPGEVSVDQMILQAQERRSEIRIAEELATEAKLSLSARKWEQAPAISVKGDYGASGNEPSDAVETGRLGVEAEMPLFTSGQLGGKRAEARGRLDEAEARLSDVRAQVEEDVRLSVDQISTSAEQVKTAQQAVDLAQSELKMARARFDAGVGSNVDLVNAQTSLARVQDAWIAALSGFEAARISEAMALGRAENFRLSK